MALTPTLDLLTAELLMHSHKPDDISPQAHGSALGADTLDDLHATNFWVYLRNTRAFILAWNPGSQPTFAYANDYKELYIWYGEWYQLPFHVVADPATPDIGYEDDSNKLGYGDTYVSDKLLANCVLGYSASTAEGSIRVNPTSLSGATLPQIQIYLSGAWRYIMWDITYQNNDCRHTPFGEQIKMWSGCSIAVGLNGRPIVNEYQVSMGAYPAPFTINGGTF